MLASLTIVDYGVLAGYAALILGVGIWFAGRQPTTLDFLLAGRSLRRFPLGMSLMVTVVAALTLTRLPGEAYEAGIKCLLVPISAWIVLPVLVGVVLPIFRGLGLQTMPEYLELRFGAGVRLAASVALVVWRLLWLAVIVYVSSQAVMIAAGWKFPLWMAIAAFGVLATSYTLLGGMKGLAWTHVIQGLAMLAGAAAVIACVWLAMPGGPERVSEVAAGLGRLEPVELRFDAQGAWSLWGALPHWVLAMLLFCSADQATAQRFLCAKSVNAARTSYLIGCVALTVLQAALVYIGVCLLAYYHEHPDRMRPEWVMNVDNKSRQPLLGADGRPLIDPREPLTAENVRELVARGKILKPNSKEPFTDAAEILDPETGELLVERLAMRRPTQGKIRGEIIVAKHSPAEMLPWFVAEQALPGAAGLALVALLAACLAAIDAVVHSTCTLVVIDFHRRFALGRAWLARRAGKSAADLTEADEMRLARPLIALLGTGVTLLAIVAAQIGDPIEALVATAHALGAPLLGVFLLGMFTRRCTSDGAGTALICGLIFTLGLATYNRVAAAGLAPKESAVHDIWLLTFGTLATLMLGYLSSFVLGRRKSKLELRGLVFGCGDPGVRASEEEVPLIGGLEVPEPAKNERRWQ